MSYEMQKESEIEERVFSVTMTEDELRLFSEFLEQREYARGVVSKMNPNMVHRRVMNGKTITKITPGKGPSIKQIKEAKIQSQAKQQVDEKISSVKAKSPKPKYESKGWKTQETAESVEARAQHGKRVEKLEKNASKKQHQISSSMKRKERAPMKTWDHFGEDYNGNVSGPSRQNNMDPRGFKNTSQLRESIRSGEIYRTKGDERVVSGDYFNKHVADGNVTWEPFDYSKSKRHINSRINKKARIARIWDRTSDIPKDHQGNLSNHEDKLWLIR